MQSKRKSRPPGIMLTAPRLWRSLLRWFCPDRLYEGIEGDLLEQFEEDVRVLGLARAKRRFAFSVLGFFRPGILFRNRPRLSWVGNDMLVNYYRVAWRNMRRNAGYSFINITGLALGLSVAIVLLSIIRFEYNFDRHHKNADRLYQIITSNKFNEPNSHVPQGVIYALRDQFAQVETASTVYKLTPQVIGVEGTNLKGKHTFFMHPEFLRMIDVKWLSGSPGESLKGPYQVVLDSETAQTFFGDDNPLGKTLRYDNVMDLVVSGVIEKMPLNSEFQFSMISSYETLTKLQQNFANHDHWGGGDSWCHGFVLVKPGADVDGIESQLNALAAKHGDQAKYVSYELVPIVNAHFHKYNDSFHYSIPFWMIKALAAIAIFIIAIAILNYVNLATAQAAQRGREIGLRKVMGGNRLSVVLQFFVETGLMVTLSVAVGSVLATQMIFFAGEFFNTQAHQVPLWDSNMFGYTAILIVGITLLAGAYPALLVSGLRPVRIFQDKSIFFSGRGISLKKSLVVIQFVIAQVMVICMLIGRQQMEFFYQTDPGFRRDGILMVDMPFHDSLQIQQRFREDLLRHSQIKSVTYGLTSPSGDHNWWWGDTHHPRLLNGEQTFRLQWIDDNYLDFYDVKLLAGRNFTAHDSSNYALINQKAVEAMGFRDAHLALGEKMTFWGNNEVTVIGVVSDYYSQGFKSEIPPHLYLNGNWNFRLAQIKIDPANPAAAIDIVKKSWQQLHPQNFFEYEFLSEQLNTFYEDERKFSNFVLLFSSLAIAIGCLGLFGVVSFVCVRRSKEISIRKVVGATLAHILALLSKEFLVLMVIAFLIAAPLSWSLMNEFLKRYTYRIDIEPGVFVLAGLGTMILSLLTVVVRTLKTANENPVQRLRSE